MIASLLIILILIAMAYFSVNHPSQKSHHSQSQPRKSGQFAKFAKPAKVVEPESSQSKIRVRETNGNVYYI